MLVSWNWLKDYVPLAIKPEDVTNRLMMAGLNHESTEKAGDDWAIDLEVTSNRPDCLGHIGVAREIAVVFNQPLTVKDPQPKTGKTPVNSLTSVTIECPDLCPRYQARVIRGVKVKSSPAWLANRLQTIGIATINNIVDISNYVLMEIGQPLHTFDFARLHGRKIIVRRAKAGEPFLAINHEKYQLDANMCVIADADRPVALGGVMGGADTEVSPETTEILVEAAEFDPLSIRRTVRKLRLPSDSSYRFERGVDSEMVDWASRRCCELILELAGGELAEGVIDVGVKRAAYPPIVLRLSQIERILGIQVPPATVDRILVALGNQKIKSDAATITVQPPSWRRDLEREIDLVEEVARIHGYDKIPEDVGVRMAASHRRDQERRDDCVRNVLTATGCDEALTPSVVSEESTTRFSPWSADPPLTTNTPLMRGADRLRKSLIPSLLEVRQNNQALGNKTVELFEMAKVYLPRAQQLPAERPILGLVSGRDFSQVKGLIESLAAQLRDTVELTSRSTSQPLLDPAACCELRLGDVVCGYVGQLNKAGLKQFGLRTPATIAEIDLGILGERANFVPQYQPVSQFPAIEQDLNFIVEEKIRWADLAAAVREAGGPLLEGLAYRETFRNPQVDGPNRKRLLLSIQLRSAEGTLTGQEAETVRKQIVAACEARVGAKLLA
jgi:phenylalanyl-tRNA synthetase beta chain